MAFLSSVEGKLYTRNWLRGLLRKKGWYLCTCHSVASPKRVVAGGWSLDTSFQEKPPAISSQKSYTIRMVGREESRVRWYGRL